MWRSPCEQFQVSERRACKLVGLDRSSYRYEPRPDHNAELRQELVESGAAETAVRIPAIACAAEQARIFRPARSACIGCIEQRV